MDVLPVAASIFALREAGEETLDAMNAESLVAVEVAVVERDMVMVHS